MKGNLIYVVNSKGECLPIPEKDFNAAIKEAKRREAKNGWLYGCCIGHPMPERWAQPKRPEQPESAFFQRKI